MTFSVIKRPRPPMDEGVLVFKVCVFAFWLPDTNIFFGGCYENRAIRGGTRPSTHSWGIALDFDPDNNPLARSESHKATFKGPEYNKWWQFWEDEGWVSLGRTLGYDWMHVQAARRSWSYFFYWFLPAGLFLFFIIQGRIYNCRI